MKRKITLKQIAKELDVSISTVSKALRNSIEISEDTRQKVQAFAKLYNYRPNNIALSLKNRKTKTIGIIIPEIVHHFFSKVITGIELVANKRGYNVIVGLSNESFDKEVINMQMLANGSIDGFILSIAKETLQQQDYHHFIETINQGMPIVMFDRVVKEIPCDKVIVDDVDGAKKAVEKLIENGCKNIAIITTKDYVSVGKLRTQGYLEALDDHKIHPKSSLILKIEDKLLSDDHLDELEKDIEQLFKSNKQIDGIFAVNELYAVTAIKVARKLGLKIPESLQVVSFTDGVLSKHSTPSLTTMSQHGQNIGEKAADLLINRLELEETDEEEEETYETIVIETELIERESTK
ncbi:LacI family DNA-binding transcriptional regulator [Psychroserpens sp.]|uniref:LacI family DNA-binding transcriptional regulator n=1 Tax=Psychroserpens sp. TaxID=2020870 RepID=UPI001B2D9524|nr:LacI family DNA-binding transcriptional regulator [Psychroserpens sp.]MBO6605735.1 LacI family DNA-binding transcriptional regulator [Psychroserpens sp.]MBO6630723.1 LacI family DNA-binding transcriptional regulator [Psychroserpens sp.]MBO6652894.1 LacI family DNA-binding transcriptional regulator [Psychroserpens sp.]MBO6681334.1 LacI family DNA-binding transcriptional regulator [Psychroserpens sp.]MBO6749109.1 LacI family DNA-binding transcriptional regulator [Psychroserpens sp.]